MEESANQSFVSTEIWAKVPAEIWTKILKLIHNRNQRKETADKRLVCQTWKNVIDNHLDFNICLKEKKSPVKFTLSHIRVNCLTVRRLVKSRKFVRSLRFPYFKKLHLNGKINRVNFFALANQNPEKLVISDQALKELTKVRAFEQGSPEDLQFCNELKSLHVTSSSKLKEIDHILKLSFPSLEELSLFQFEKREWSKPQNENIQNLATTLFTFLQKSPGLRSVDIYLNPISIQQDHLLEKLFAFKIEHQLESLDLNLGIALLFSWLLTIQAQRKLKVIKIFAPNSDLKCPEISTTERFRLFEGIFETLSFNQNTLTTVSLVRFQMQKPLNMKMFKNMKNLKKLNTSGFIVNMKPGFINLCELPISLTILTLGKATCLASDLLNMSERLEGLKVADVSVQAKLDFMGHVDSNEIHRQIIKNLTGHVRRNNTSLDVSVIFEDFCIEIVPEFKK